ncbi:unannotated protein [freshwater metagenome]|uniref:Unannotated protein n=1 Tax=freshwater metagenome TaxID=449393 RepID=A0A6J6KXB4_9ZZZZ
MKKKIAVIAAASLMVLAACGSDDNSSDTTDTTANSTPAAEVEYTPKDAADAGTIFVEIASSNEQFGTLFAAVAVAGLGETLGSEGPFTLFAPTKAAFDALPQGLLTKLLLPANKAVLAEILAYHVVAGKILAADVAAGDVATVQGENVTIDTTDGVKINTATVTQTDFPATNGVIHMINEVLVPPSIDVAAFLAS